MRELEMNVDEFADGWIISTEDVGFDDDPRVRTNLLQERGHRSLWRAGAMNVNDVERESTNLRERLLEVLCQIENANASFGECGASGAFGGERQHRNVMTRFRKLGGKELSHPLGSAQAEIRRHSENFQG